MKAVSWYCLLLYCVALFAALIMLMGRAEASDLVTTIRTIAIEEGVDPNLAVAIARVESGLNPKKIGGLGEVGTFQLRPEYHVVVPGNVKANARTAIRYLKLLKSTHQSKYGEAWFIAYNVGPNYRKKIRYPTKFKYYVDVMSAMNRQRVERVVRWNP